MNPRRAHRLRRVVRDTRHAPHLCRSSARRGQIRRNAWCRARSARRLRGRLHGRGVRDLRGQRRRFHARSHVVPGRTGSGPAATHVSASGARWRCGNVVTRPRTRATVRRIACVVC